MFCENCGAKLEDDSKFCEVCGTPVNTEAPEAVCPECEIATETAEPVYPECEIATETAEPVYPEYTIATETAEVEPVSLSVTVNLLNSLAQGKCEFVTLTPKSEVQGSRFLQACGDDGGNGTMHIELCMSDGQGGIAIFARNGVTVTEAIHFYTVYLVQGLLPDMTEWEKL